ncbi:MAG TPA: DNA polymerase III subunit gamma/tau [Candidatus Saccharimonadia bacterium]|nr:DNA polymerase III subunit gamma/tau [Candidatus Saccharimonadia bacterium]
MSWYRTYRPHTIGGLHLPLVRAALDRVRLSGSFSHAYLFTGPKGTGKTSSARIMAMMLNCEKNRASVEKFLKTGKAIDGGFVEPCGECNSCKKIALGGSFNVTEMDAASNRGIDDIRLLRERLNLAPTDGPVAVYIIDEVHMLTTEAFNALLKVLEEPPKHVVFILATTELHKVPETVLSRCTMINYTKARVEDISAALKNVLKTEKITFDEELLTAIALQADGSFRDAIKALENVAVGKKAIGMKDLGEGQSGALAQAQSLILALRGRDVEKVASLFRDFTEHDVDVLFVQKQTLRIIHENLLIAIDKKDLASAQKATDMLTMLNTPLDPLLPIAHLPFELACVQWCLGATEKVGGSGEKTIDINVEVIEKTQRKPEHITAKLEKTTPEIEQETEVLVEPDVEPIDPNQTLVLDQVLTRWQDILKEVRPTNASIGALLRDARPSKADGKAVTIEVFYPFHKEQLELEKHRRVLESVITQMFSLPRIRLVFVLGEKKKLDAMNSTQPAATPEDKKQDDAMAQDAADAFLS